MSEKGGCEGVVEDVEGVELCDVDCGELRFGLRKKVNIV
jgi:hypothetical protein